MIHFVQSIRTPDYLIGERMLRVVLYNTKDFGREPDTEDGRRHDALVRDLIIGEIKPDARTIIMLTELPAHSLGRAQRTTQELAESVGMTCLVRPDAGPKRPDVYAVAPSIDPATHNHLCVGIMWGSDLKPQQDSFYIVALSDYHTAGAMLTLWCEDIPMTVLVRHQPSLAGRGGNREFVQHQRIVGSERVVHALTAPGNSRFCIVGEDANSISASLVDGHYYDPDPYRPDGPACEVSAPTDRRPSQVLINAGLVDLAPHCQPYGWRPTTGHWPSEENGERRIDLQWGSKPVATAMTIARQMEPAPSSLLPDYWVYDSPTGRAASDHLAIETRHHEDALRTVMSSWPAHSVLR